MGALHFQGSDRRRSQDHSNKKSWYVEFGCTTRASLSRRGRAQSFSRSIHSQIYEGQFSNFTPFASQCTKKRIRSRLITPTSFRSKTMPPRSLGSSKSLLNSAIAGVSIRPLRMNTVNLPRSVVSILKVIDQA